MEKSKTIILVIEDTTEFKTHSALSRVREKYEQVEFFESAKEGLHFLKQNLGKRIIVVLDYQLSNQEKGNKVLHEIKHDISHLIPVIFWTANRIEEIVEIVEDKVFAIVPKSATIFLLVNKIIEAENELKHSLEGALEEWILLQEESNLDLPYMITANGQQYSLKDILNNIRLANPIGKVLEKDLMMLTIDLLLRQKEKLND